MVLPFLASIIYDLFTLDEKINTLPVEQCIHASLSRELTHRV